VSDDRLWEEGFSFLAHNGIEFSLADRSGLRLDCERFLGLLSKKNEVLNLTSIRSKEETFWKHLVDSLLLLSFEPMTGVLDWGTGGGFPGIPYILGKKHRGENPQVVFLDSVGKKIRAVEEFLSEMDLLSFGRCINERGESFLKSGGPFPFDSIVMRAVAPTERAKHWISFPKGVRRWVLFLGPQQLDLWKAEEKFLNKRSIVFGSLKAFTLPHDMGSRHLLELRKK
jgi:16S rRNA (guanine527-N7)-methyltransferase